MMRVLIFIGIALLLTVGFITIEGFTCWAWLSLGAVLGMAYESYYVSQENNVKINNVVIDRINKLKDECTRMSTIMGEVRDNLHPKRKFDSSKFKKN